LADRILLVMVGLPARGKTYIARRLHRYLSWRGHPTRLFNVGEYRRHNLGKSQSHEWFDPNNAEARMQRLQLAMEALDDVFDYLRGEGEVAIFDATNSTRRRRDMLHERCAEHGVRLIFLESICSDPLVIERNIRETKLRSPDYVGVDPEAAVRDFRARIEQYSKVYESIEDDRLSYVQLVDLGRKTVVNRMHGRIEDRIVRFLRHLPPVPQTVWLTRHGRSEYNDLGLIGGDAPLSAAGAEYARRLADYVREHEPAPMEVWTSTLKRTVQTAEPLGRATQRFRRLDEIHAGVCEGMSYAQIQAEMPEEFAARKRDKFRYRYPRGESYDELIERIDTVVLELERRAGPTLVIGHQAVLRALYAYLMGIERERCPHVDIPLHTVLQLEPDVYSLREQRIALGP
jgi:broad specificity phosphatase PhoE/predicted kinase